MEYGIDLSGRSVKHIVACVVRSGCREKKCECRSVLKQAGCAADVVTGGVFLVRPYADSFLRFQNNPRIDVPYVARGDSNTTGGLRVEGMLDEIGVVCDLCQHDISGQVRISIIFPEK